MIKKYTHFKLFSVVVFKQDSCRHRDVMVPEPTEICSELRAFGEDII